MILFALNVLFCFPFYVLIIRALLMMLVTFKKVCDTLYEANHVDLVSFPSQLGADDCSANSEAAECVLKTFSPTPSSATKYVHIHLELVPTEMGSFSLLFSCICVYMRKCSHYIRTFKT